MSVRAFPRTREEPKKRILLIPIMLIFGGLVLLYVPPFQFIGAIISLTGALSIFLVGMVFADLWAASRRTRAIIKEREKHGLDVEEDDDVDENYDPFEDKMGEEPTS